MTNICFFLPFEIDMEKSGENAEGKRHIRGCPQDTQMEMVQQINDALLVMNGTLEEALHHTNEFMTLDLEKIALYNSENFMVLRRDGLMRQADNLCQCFIGGLITEAYKNPERIRTQITEIWVTNTNEEATRNVTIFVNGVERASTLMYKSK